MTFSKREYFDKQVEWVLERLPKKVRQLLDEIPLHVEDRPSHRMIREMEIESDEELCGCFVGVALGERYERNQQVPNTVILFRQGIYAQAVNEQGIFSQIELRRQIRMTILHELGHFHGLDEEELDQLGYG
ncbi:MAG: metallopeptidase family protein [Planctomycetaceae bacterium]|jgi:predicted Zn-dependent protease with MMP-like domain|nr:metallopeptidase family protein [Planctomycetaceae bacterium]